MWDEISHHYKLRELQRKQKRANDSDSCRIEKARNDIYFQHRHLIKRAAIGKNLK